MNEPRVRVLLLSDLFGCFAEDGRPETVSADAYRSLVKAGVEVVFISGAPRAVCRRALAKLEPEPVFLAAGGSTVSSPAGHLLPSGPLPITPDQRGAADWVIGRYGLSGDIVIPFGIGGSPDDSFLEAVELAALIRGGSGEICPHVPRPEVTYSCSRPGPAGWVEWAEVMLRKIEILSNRR